VRHLGLGGSLVMGRAHCGEANIRISLHEDGMAMVGGVRDLSFECYLEAMEVRKDVSYNGDLKDS